MPEQRDPRLGNAFVSIDEAGPPKQEQQQKELQTFEGVGSVKKKEKTGFAKWFCEMFLSGRTVREVMMDILNKQIVPEGKDMLINGAVSVLYGIFYKDSTPGQYTGGQSGNFITRYIDYSKISNGSSPTKNAATQAALEANQQKDKEMLNAGYELPSFPNYKMAEDFLNSMKAEVSRYDQLSVYDMSWKRGKTIPWTWNAYGWYKDEILAIRQPSRFRQPIVVTDSKGNKIKMTHYIDMPPSHPIE